jgi:hypothetical protein
LNNGLLHLDHFWVGGPYGGTVNHNGGSFSGGIVHLEGGVYSLRGGDFDATVYSGEGALFRQDGGRVNSNIQLFRGGYLFNGGANYGGVTIPVPGNGGSDNGNSWAAQNGGTNFGPIAIGDLGNGSYTLTNGAVQSPSIAVKRFGLFHQINGRVSSSGTVNLVGGWYGRGGRALANYTLERGFLVSPEIYMDTGDFVQLGGTNQIAGDLRLINTTHNYYVLSGGLLTDQNTSVDGAWVGGFTQSGGTHVIANQFSISGNELFGWNGFVFIGGDLIVSNIVLNPRAIFNQSGGRLTQSGTLSAAAATIYVPAGGVTFGAFQLNASGSLTNTTMFMPSNSATVRFRDSRALQWASGATLLVEKWAGSYLGGGTHRIIFGSSSAALTAQQVRQIYFHDPGGGLSPGMHPARILPSGEVVPDSQPPVGRTPPRLAIRKLSDGTQQITLTGEAGYNYEILRSFYLSSPNWEFWTSGTASNGTLSFVDNETWPATRFYRAVLMR